MRTSSQCLAEDEAASKGNVREEDKDGNDQADVGADKGAGIAQAALAEIAGLFSDRNEKYRQLLERIQIFIVKMKKAEQIKRQEQMRSQAPFDELLTRQ